MSEIQMTDSLPPPSELLPHGPPMRFIDAVVEQRSDGVVCATKIDDDFVLLRNGTADMATCLELVAQSVGCYVGLADHAKGARPRPGYLVGCREAWFEDDVLRTGDELLTTVRERWVESGVASFLGEVARDGKVVARVEISVYAARNASGGAEAGK